MLYIFGLYLLIGVMQTLILLAILKSRNIITTKEDNYQLFTLCAVLTVAYPYLAIRSAYKKFIEENIKIIDAKEVN